MNQIDLGAPGRGLSRLQRAILVHLHARGGSVWWGNRPSFYGGPTCDPFASGGRGRRRFDPAERADVSRSLRRLAARDLVVLAVPERWVDPATGRLHLVPLRPAAGERVQQVSLTEAGASVAAELAAQGVATVVEERHKTSRGAVLRWLNARAPGLPIVVHARTSGDRAQAIRLVTRPELWAWLRAGAPSPREAAAQLLAVLDARILDLAWQAPGRQPRRP